MGGLLSRYKRRGVGPEARGAQAEAAGIVPCCRFWWVSTAEVVRWHDSCQSQGGGRSSRATHSCQLPAATTQQSTSSNSHSFSTLSTSSHLHLHSLAPNSTPKRPNTLTTPHSPTPGRFRSYGVWHKPRRRVLFVSPTRSRPRLVLSTTNSTTSHSPSLLRINLHHVCGSTVRHIHL